MSTNAILMGRDAMLAQSLKLSVIGNNIANSNTVGFKSRSVIFSDREGFYVGPTWSNGLRANLGRGVDITAGSANWQNGVIGATNVDTHIAISGNGMLPVELNGQTMYTRSGDFSMVETASGSGTYYLMRPDGSLLMGGALTGETVSLDGPVTFTGAPTAIRVGQNGLIEADGATVTNGQIGLQRFVNPDALTQVGMGVYQTTDNAGIISDTPTAPGYEGCGEIIQGALEQSNVDLVNEFSEMILCQRAFQANSRTITTANEMLQEVLNIKR